MNKILIVLLVYYFTKVKEWFSQIMLLKVKETDITDQ